MMMSGVGAAAIETAISAAPPALQEALNCAGSLGTRALQPSAPKAQVRKDPGKAGGLI